MSANGDHNGNHNGTRSAAAAAICGVCRYSMLHATAPLCSCSVGALGPADHPLALSQPACELFAKRRGDDLTLHTAHVPKIRQARRPVARTCGSCRYAMVHAVSPHCDCSIAATGSPHRLSLFQPACSGYQGRPHEDLSLHVYSPLRETAQREAALVR